MGEHLLKPRRDLGLTQVQAAKALGVKVGTITIWGEEPPGALRRPPRRIIRFLGYDPRAGSSPLSRR